MSNYHASKAAAKKAHAETCVTKQVANCGHDGPYSINRVHAQERGNDCSREALYFFGGNSRSFAVISIGAPISGTSI
jgi:hypothetical protein